MNENEPEPTPEEVVPKDEDKNKLDDELVLLSLSSCTFFEEKDKLYIQFDDESRSFLPGQDVTGKVVVKLAEPKPFKRLNATCMGRARVTWETTHGRRSSYQTNCDAEYYFSSTIPLFGDGHFVTTLPSGSNEYPFKFTLPLDLPASYGICDTGTGTWISTTKSDVASVCYEIRADMERPKWLGRWWSTTEPFTVSGILDLNKNPNVKLPVLREHARYMYFLWCKSGPVGYKIALPRTGFVPGEIVPFNAEFINKSSNFVRDVTLTLVEHGSFHANCKVKTQKTEVFSRKFGPIDPGSSAFWSGQSAEFVIPQVPPTRLGEKGCRIINIKYTLELVMHLTGCTKNIIMDSIPITIGTLPLLETFPNLLPSDISESKTFLALAKEYDGDQGGVDQPPLIPICMVPGGSLFVEDVGHDDGFLGLVPFPCTPFFDIIS